MASKPTKLEIRAYNIGFGDCFLLTFHYGSNEKNRRHALIDFGTTRKPDDAGSDHELNIAKDIAEVTGERLDVVVATHRHKDHISGFRTSANPKKEEPGDIIRKCAEKAMVILPWTEDPDLPTDATSRKAFVGQLDAMHAFAAAVVREVKHDQSAGLHADADVSDPTEVAASSGPKQRMHREESDDSEGGNWFSAETLRERLRFIGEDAISNVSAVTNLVTMGPDKHRHFVNYGYELDLTKFLPGVKVKVLGPPDIDQWPQVQKQNPKNKEQYWHMQAAFWQRLALNTEIGTSDAGSGVPLFPKAKVCEPKDRCSHKPKKCPEIPRASEWFVRRLRGVRTKQLMQLALSMDAAMNNTSVILLFEVGGKRLLFPGDAQWENWQYALEGDDGEENLKDLSKVDVYKVGHHGSLNATPKKLWDNFAKRNENPEAKTRMRSLISTKKGVHAHSPQTAVPRTTLVTALKENTNYRSTEPVKPKDLCFVEEIDL